MEINVNNGSAVVQNTALSNQHTDRSADLPANEKGERTDRADISDEAKLYAKAAEKIALAESFLAENDSKSSDQTAEAMNKMTEEMKVMLEIYRRMSKGAHVSPTDENSLMEYNQPMYLAAKNAQLMAKKHKDMSDETLVDRLSDSSSDSFSVQLEAIQQSFLPEMVPSENL